MLLLHSLTRLPEACVLLALQQICELFLVLLVPVFDLLHKCGNDNELLQVALFVFADACG